MRNRVSEDKTPAPKTENQRTTQRRARTAESTKGRQLSPHTARATQKPPAAASSRRQRDLSDSVIQTQTQVTEILEAITSIEADAVAVKNSLSLLLRVIRSAPQITAECIHEQKGELLLLDTIQTHSSHAVLLCYGCVLMRKLCHLSVESVELFVQHGIIPTVAQALLSFPEDAILQASACGCLAVLTQTSDASKNEMLAMNDPSILRLVLASLEIHREYSNLTRQVQIYACEVLTELCDYGGPSTVASLIAYDRRRKTESPIQLAVSLTQQSMAREDKKVACSFCSLLLCLASNSPAAAASLREFGAIADISVVMAKYPVDEGIIRFSTAALREIAETSLSHSPSKSVHEKARLILDEHPSPFGSTPAFATKQEHSPVAAVRSSRNRDTSPRSTSRKGGDSGQKSTGRRRPKSPTNRPNTSSGIPVPSNVRSFGQMSSALGVAPGSSFFSSPVKLVDDTRTATPKASRLPPPRSRDEHIQRAGEMKRRKNGNEQRDRLLMKTYGQAPIGSKTQRSSDAIDRGLSREISLSRFSPLKNNYLGAEGVTFVIPPPLSSSQSLEQPIGSRGTKTPTRPHSARLTPLMNERVKISPATSAAEWGSGDDALPMESSMSTGNLRPQTAVVVTKVADPSSQRGRRIQDPGKRKPARDSPRTSKTARRSPRGRRKGSPLSRSSSPDIQDDTTSQERYTDASSGPPARISSSSDLTDMDQSMAELREFAQQLLKEEARISSLLAQTGSKSPGLNRMSFSDKLHKMIQIAESSMYERSLAMTSSHAGGDATARTPLGTAQVTPDARAERSTAAVSRDVAKTSSSRKAPQVADSKSDAPKLPSSGYKKSRASTVGQQKEKKASPKVDEMSPRGDRKLLLSKLDPTVRSPSIPFLEPLDVGLEKAPAKNLSEQEEDLGQEKFILTATEDSPYQQEGEADAFHEESIKEEIPVTVLLPIQALCHVEEKENEPIPENIDVVHDESRYHNFYDATSVPTTEEVPIIEEIGFASPSNGDSAMPLEEDTFEEDQHTFEPPGDRKSEEEETDLAQTRNPSQSEPDYPDGETDEFEFIELSIRSQEGPTVVMDWTMARGACQQVAAHGIAAALVELEAMGGLCTVLPEGDTAGRKFDEHTENLVQSPALMSSVDNNDEYEDHLTVAMSRAVALSVKAMLTETVGNVLQRLQLQVESENPSTAESNEVVDVVGQPVDGVSGSTREDEAAVAVDNIFENKAAVQYEGVAEVLVETEVSETPEESTEPEAAVAGVEEEAVVAEVRDAVEQALQAVSEAASETAAEAVPMGESAETETATAKTSEAETPDAADAADVMDLAAVAEALVSAVECAALAAVAKETVAAIVEEVAVDVSVETEVSETPEESTEPEAAVAGVEEEAVVAEVRDAVEQALQAVSEAASETAAEAVPMGESAETETATAKTSEAETPDAADAADVMDLAAVAEALVSAVECAALAAVAKETVAAIAEEVAVDVSVETEVSETPEESTEPEAAVAGVEEEAVVAGVEEEAVVAEVRDAVEQALQAVSEAASETAAEAVPMGESAETETATAKTSEAETPDAADAADVMDLAAVAEALVSAVECAALAAVAKETVAAIVEEVAVDVSVETEVSETPEESTEPEAAVAGVEEEAVVA
ncbi:hypothetical protein PC116_g24775, partial [Phytophthora cactorum]